MASTRMGPSDLFGEVSSPSRRGLTPTRLFRMVTEETLRDGVISTEENRLLRALVPALGIPAHTSVEIVRQTQDRVGRGALGRPRDFSALTLYERAVETFLLGIGCPDEVARFQKNLLVLLASLLRITPAQHRQALAGIRRRVQEATAPVPRDASAPVGLDDPRGPLVVPPPLEALPR